MRPIVCLRVATHKPGAVSSIRARQKHPPFRSQSDCAPETVGFTHRRAVLVEGRVRKQGAERNATDGRPSKRRGERTAVGTVWCSYACRNRFRPLHIHDEKRGTTSRARSVDGCRKHIGPERHDRVGLIAFMKETSTSVEREEIGDRPLALINTRKGLGVDERYASVRAPTEG